MDNGIHIGYMTGTYAGFLQSCRKRQDGQTKQAGTAGTFRSAAERIAQGAAAADASRPAAADMTLEEYRLYLYDTISGIRPDASQAGWNRRITVSDDGLEAMRKDPAYGRHVLDTIRRNLSVRDPFHSRTFSVMHFGASDAESYGESWTYDSPAQHLGQKEKTYWEERIERREKQQEQLEELTEKKAVARQQGLPEPCALDIRAILELL